MKKSKYTEEQIKLRDECLNEQWFETLHRARSPCTEEFKKGLASVVGSRATLQDFEWLNSLYSTRHRRCTRDK